MLPGEFKDGGLYRLLPEASTFAKFARDHHGYLWLCVDASRARFKSVATGVFHAFHHFELEEEG